MPDYLNGKIYELRSYKKPNLIYIGSTTQVLSERKRQHKNAYNRWLEGKGPYTSSFEIIELGNYYIELKERYSCNSKEELNRREGEIIRETENCVNKRIAGRTMKQCYEDNKEKILDQHKEYYEKNKEKVSERMKEYYKGNKGKISDRHKEYYEKNKAKVLEQQKEYYEKNKAKVLERHNKHYKEKKKGKVTCECGKTVQKDGLPIHKRTKVHQNFMMLCWWT